MTGLVPVIHVVQRMTTEDLPGVRRTLEEHPGYSEGIRVLDDVDGRDKPGHDG